MFGKKKKEDEKKDDKKKEEKKAAEAKVEEKTPTKVSSPFPSTANTLHANNNRPKTQSLALLSLRMLEALFAKASTRSQMGSQSLRCVFILAMCLQPSTPRLRY